MAKRLTARLSAGAALVTGLGMMGLATAVPAHADITKELAYSCAVSDLGIQFEDPWTVNLNIGVDDQYDTGAEIAAPTITAAVTPGDDANERMRSLNIKSLEGKASTAYSFGGTQRTTELTIPKVDVPAEGSVTATGTGTGSAETAPAEDTTVDITAGDFTAALTTDTGFVLNLACTAPTDATVGTVTIGDAPVDPEPTDPEPTTSEPTTSEPTTSEPTTSEPTTSEPTAEANDWFSEPSSLPITEDGKHFTVEGTSDQAGRVNVVLLDKDKKVLRTIAWDVAEGSNTKDFPFAEGTDYVRLVSEDCVDAAGNDGSVAGGCNVEYYAPWVNPDSETPGGDDGSDGPETPGVVQTDGFTRVEQPAGDNNAALLLGGVLLAGAGAGSVVLVRRRQSAQH